MDVAVTLFDGKFHTVDSSETAFRTAARIAFRDAMAKARPVLLEPVSSMVITTPADRQGDVLADLSTRRGRVQDTAVGDAGEQIVYALVRAAEMQRYAIDLRSLTGGRGSFTAEHSHYDVAPPNLAEKVRRSVHGEE